MQTSNQMSSYRIRKLKRLVEEKTGYYIRDNDLFLQAFTRRSYRGQYGGEDNEVLEFIGDRVLEYYVVKALVERYGMLNRKGEYDALMEEDGFSQLKVDLVNNHTLAGIIDEWGLAQYLIVGKADLLNRADEVEKVRGDLFESILGAIAIACRWDAQVLETAVRRMLSLDERFGRGPARRKAPNIPLEPEKAVVTLKEMADRGECPRPVYETFGPDSIGYGPAGMPQWAVRCTVADWGLVRQVTASSKQMAKRYAAWLMLCAHYGLPGGAELAGDARSGPNWLWQNGRLSPDSP